MLTSVLVVDTEGGAGPDLAALFSADGYAVSAAHDVASARQHLSATPPDLVVLDMTAPGLDAFTLCGDLKRDPGTRLLPVVLIAAEDNRDQRLRAFEAGADEVLNQPVVGAELMARARALVRVKRYTDDLDSASSIIMTLAVMIESRDGYTEGHCHRLANYATALGRRLHLGPDELQALHRGGFLHDIGMLAVPDVVLRKTGSLSAEEFEAIKSHTVIGESLLSHLHSLHPVRPIVRSHHERRDGSGYPDGLSGDDIPLLAQILSVTDAYDALTSPRPYQPEKSPAEAIDVLRQEVARGLRREDLVEHFAEIVNLPMPAAAP